MHFKIQNIFWLVLLCVLPYQLAMSQENYQTELIELWPGLVPDSEQQNMEEQKVDRGSGELYDTWISQVSQPTIEVYLPAEQDRCGTAIVICPGGGYGGLSMVKEGHALAKWFCERGVVAGALKYRHAPYQHPIPLNDAQRALRIMRSRAGEWQLDEAKVGIAGFSAGGHLASSAGTHFDEGKSGARDTVERVSCRPDFMVLVYPVISMEEKVTHGGSRKNLLGNDPSPELVELMSNEKQVTSKTGPTFLVHASDDGAVPEANSLRFYQALREYKIPAELHIYETGGHGFGFYRGDRPVDRWPDLMEGWLKKRGLLGK